MRQRHGATHTRCSSAGHRLAHILAVERPRLASHQSNPLVTSLSPIKAANIRARTVIIAPYAAAINAGERRLCRMLHNPIASMMLTSKKIRR